MKIDQIDLFTSQVVFTEPQDVVNSSGPTKITEYEEVI